MPPDVIARVHYYETNAAKRAFYGSKQKDDYIGYIDKGALSTKAIDYLDYAGDEEKSSGVFDANGLLRKTDKKFLREKLRGTQSCIWDMVVSFEENYGKTNLTEFTNARELLIKTLPRFFRHTGLNPDNVAWFAGLHTNTDNRHIHICFFENEPQKLHRKTGELRYRHGKIRREALDAFKADTLKYFMQPVEGVARVRKFLTEKARSVVALPYRTYSTTLKRLVKTLYEKVPFEGKTAYECDNLRACRDTVDATINCVLKNATCRDEYATLTKKLAERDGEILRLCVRNKIRNPENYLYAEKFQHDLRRRMGNIIIQSVVKKRREEILKTRELRHAKKRMKIRLDTFIDCVLSSMEIAARADREAQECMEEFLEKLEQTELQSQMEQAEL